MKKHLTYLSTFLMLFVLSFSDLRAQESPKAAAQNTVDGVSVKIDYFSPRVRERIIWGGLVPYDEVWRTGANNATTLEVSDNMKIDNNKLPKGKYALFTIPKNGSTWTVIINKVADQWGAFNYDEKQDLFRFDVEVKQTIDSHENMEFQIADDGTVTFFWEYKTFTFKISK